jgi:hypothetical protein
MQAVLSGDNGGEGRIDWDTVSMAHDCDDLYVRYQITDGPPFNPDGFRYNMFVDVDRNPTTGYRGAGTWLPIGADVLIQGGQDRVTTFKFTGAGNQGAWSWQEIKFYPVSDQLLANGRRDIEYRIGIADLDVLGNGVSSFDWVTWADHTTGVMDISPDEGFDTYTLAYSPTGEGFVNPERGFTEPTETHASNYSPVNLATLQCYRNNEGISLIHRYFYLETFVDSDISQQYLDMMQGDFDKIRQAGLKVIPRFAYSESAGPGLTPPYGDASKQRILSHLDQLSAVLRRNSDVIAVMEAGFIGLWGEWWYSDYFLPDGTWSDRADVLSGMLEILPGTRTIQVRTPRYKQNIYGNITPVDLASAHDGSNRARTGHHNDCFVSSLSDGGTYVDPANEYIYLEEETKWVPMGGETCDYNALVDPAPNRLNCSVALNELAKFHWSFLNLDWYRPTLRKWLDEGCLSEIEERLGYHLVFLQETYDQQIRPGDMFNFTLSLKNEGFAAPFNPRAVELILRHSDGSTYAFALDQDPRFWLPGTTVAISAEIPIPENFPTGDYEVLLNMPDPEPTLHQRPEYSICFANEGMCETGTGYNRLNRHLIVLADLTDTDGDSLADTIENQVGTNPNNPDTDGDGITDFDELNRDGDPTNYTRGVDTDPGSDPNHGIDPLVADPKDTDGDGFNDGDEIHYNSDPLVKSDTPANGDVNEDGTVNVADLLIAIRIAMNLIPNPSPAQMMRADVAPWVNGIPVPDGKITAGDILRIQQLVLSH